MDLRTYVKLDATDLAELMKMKEISPQELIELSFRQLENVNPSLNAVTSTRMEKALEEAAKLDPAAYPFGGVPVLLKNISQSLKGEPMTSGSRLLSETIAKQDSQDRKSVV